MLESGGFEVFGEAAGAAAGLEGARMLESDIALVDIHLPDGFDLTARLAALHRPPSAVLTSSREWAEFESVVERSSARGFVPKHELSGEALEELLE